MMSIMYKWSMRPIKTVIALKAQEAEKSAKDQEVKTSKKTKKKAEADEA